MESLTQKAPRKWEARISNVLMPIGFLGSPGVLAINALSSSADKTPGYAISFGLTAVGALGAVIDFRNNRLTQEAPQPLED